MTKSSRPLQIIHLFVTLQLAWMLSLETNQINGNGLYNRNIL